MTDSDLPRREWLARTTLTAGLLGLPPAWRGALLSGRGPRRTTRSRYLELAVAAARWIETSRQPTDHGVRWPADPLQPDRVGMDLYNGMAGVVLFLAQLYHSTRDPRWKRSAEAGADHLVAEARSRGDALDPGLYTGLAGIAFAVASVSDATGEVRYDQAARDLVDRLAARAQPAGAGVEWNDGYDVIRGSAGIGLWLLEAHRRWSDDRTLGLARNAGLRLIDAAVPAREGGLMWFPAAGSKRNYPNFSHGTSGVAYFLATLYERTGDRSFLEAAEAGATYLDRIATRRDGGTLIFHHEPGGRDLYYLSWCHGPAGTSRLFHRLYRTTGERVWLDWVHSLTRGLLSTPIPEQRTPGFWENISQCCGNVGVGQFFLDLERSMKDETGRDMIDRVAADTMKRATRDERGLRWIQAENRLEPEVSIAQTGFMQGAAGVGTFLIELDRAARGDRGPIRFPDTPF